MAKANETFSKLDLEIQAVIQKVELPETDGDKVFWDVSENYWIPVIAMYSGMQLEEISRLRKSDIIESDGGIKCFGIPTKISGKEKVQRRVPIHSALIDLGFLKFWESCKTDSLFPKIKKNLKSGYNWRWFSQRASMEMKCFNRLRLGVIMQMKKAGVSEELITDIQGNPSPNAMQYTNVSVVICKEAIEKIKYPGLSLYKAHCRPTSVDKESPQQKPYTNEEIQAIVDRLELPEVTDDKFEWKKPGNFWIPLIALFSGMRKSEICQLYKSDVTEVAGMQCIRVADQEEGQTLKSKLSRRYVPIHSRLVEIGFLKYVEGCQGRLFPELTIVRDGYSHSWKWFDRMVARDVSKEPGKSFHSLRHGVANQLADAGISIHLQASFFGRAAVELDESFMSPSISALSNAVEKITYPGVTFDRLIVAKG